MEDAAVRVHHETLSTTREQEGGKVQSSFSAFAASLSPRAQEVRPRTTTPGDEERPRRARTGVLCACGQVDDTAHQDTVRAIEWGKLADQPCAQPRRRQLVARARSPSTSRRPCSRTTLSLNLLSSMALQIAWARSATHPLVPPPKVQPAPPQTALLARAAHRGRTRVAKTVRPHGRGGARYRAVRRHATVRCCALRTTRVSTSRVGSGGALRLAEEGSVDGRRRCT